MVNVRYLTGLASSNAAVLVPADGWPVLATDSRYAPGRGTPGCPDLSCVVTRAVAAGLAALAAERGLRRLAFEAHEMTVEQRRRRWPPSAALACGRSAGWWRNCG